MTKLEQLELLSRKIFIGRMKGERRSKRKGQSVEFADYRNYVVGDDLRSSTGTSTPGSNGCSSSCSSRRRTSTSTSCSTLASSMDCGKPHKGLYVKRVAAAIAYIGLVNYNRVSLYGYSDGLGPRCAACAGGGWSQVIGFLGGIPLEGKSDLAAVAKRFAIRHTARAW